MPDFWITINNLNRNYLEKNTTPNPNVPVPSSQPQQPQQPQPTPTTPVAVNPPRTSKSPLSTSRTSSNSRKLLNTKFSYLFCRTSKGRGRRIMSINEWSSACLWKGYCWRWQGSKKEEGTGGHSHEIQNRTDTNHSIDATVIRLDLSCT